MRQRLFQHVQRGELALVDAGKALLFFADVVDILKGMFKHGEITIGVQRRGHRFLNQARYGRYSIPAAVGRQR